MRSSLVVQAAGCGSGIRSLVRELKTVIGDEAVLELVLALRPAGTTPRGTARVRPPPASSTLVRRNMAMSMALELLSRFGVR